MTYDAQGWLQGRIEPPPLAQSWMLLSPEPSSAMQLAQWNAQAAQFFQVGIRIEPAKAYPNGGWPRNDQAAIHLCPSDDPKAWTQVRLWTVPWNQVPLAHKRAEQAVAAIGGAGFDALIPRTQRLWQIAAAPVAGADARAAIRLAGVLASLWLAPVIPPSKTPGEVTIFGVKGVRQRLG